MEDRTNCPRCDTFIGNVGFLDTCPVCGACLIGDCNGDWSKEEGE